MKYFKPFILLLLFFIIAHADLTTAYSLYLTGDIDSAYTLYSEVHSVDSNNLDAIYGLINCYIAKKDLKSALQLTISSIDKYKAPALFSKAAYIYGKNNDNSNATKIYTTARQLFSDSSSAANTLLTTGNDIADIIYSAGCGFYDRLNFKQARSWFSMGDSLFNEITLFKQALINTGVALKSAVRYSFNVNGGYLAYSQDATYSSGNFFTATTALLFNDRRQYKLSYSNTTIRNKKLYYGVNYDTLIASKHGSPDTAVQTVLSSKTFTNIDGLTDTIYYTYSQSLTTKNNSSYDTIINYNPDTYTQNDLYFSYTDYGVLLHSTNISAGGRLSFTTMDSDNHCNTFFIKHATSIKLFVPGCTYYVTFIDYNQFVQISPFVNFSKGLFFSELTFNTIKPFNKPKEAVIPDDFQFSYDILAGLQFKFVKLSLSVSLGDKAFYNGSDAEFLHNVLSPYDYGLKGILEWTPNKWLTLYTLLDYSNYSSTVYNKVKYKDYIKFATMGGLYIQW